MNYNDYYGCNEYAGTYEGAYYAGEDACARTAYTNRGGSCDSFTASAAGRTGNGNCRSCDLYWEGFIAGFYSNNRCNRSDVTRTAAQAAGRTAAAASCRCSCNGCSGCRN